MTDPSLLEGPITKKILNWLRKQPECFAYKVVAQPKQMSGVPDISCVWRGWSVWIEVKSPSNKRGPTPNQLQRMKQIEAAGGIVFVARSLANVKARLRELESRT
jgi:hypothetical protein